ncbi:MAG: hypothetical protein P0Y53_20585 [Candidatus Pseudobacter hemicellulosilyticus]|uniref:Uncharacterized protein n=1 Tax=Candidatus Pseudobacter hemicellulosilyticus TaxID=3121375 RepID=A0AAJ5WSI6_9BACT|nr:MAG: hypothetical protein P0Y53_20585 [Pseudobacter sp.]
MNRFVTRKLSNVRGLQSIEQLVILQEQQSVSAIYPEDIAGVWDIYERQLEDRYAGSFRGLEAIMNRVANLQTVSRYKFKDITPSRELVKEYEFKYQDLRAYAIKIANGKLVVLAGFKNSQKADISKFRRLKELYLTSLKNY